MAKTKEAWTIRMSEQGNDEPKVQDNRMRRRTRQDRIKQKRTTGTQDTKHTPKMARRHPGHGIGLRTTGSNVLASILQGTGWTDGS